MPDLPLDLVTFGEAMVEFDGRAPGIWHQGVGGDTLNVAVAARRAGARVGFASALGVDIWGDAILDVCAAETIGTSAVLRDARRHTGLYFVSHDRKGHHFTYQRSGSAASAHIPGPELGTVLSGCKCLHISGISLAVSPPENGLLDRILAATSSSGAKLSFDPNYRNRLWPAEKARGPILAAMKVATILLPGMEDMRNLFGLGSVEDALAFCSSLGPEILVLKDGRNDIHVLDTASHVVVTPPRVDAKDANGAGDCFDGVFLAAVLAGKSSAHAAWEATREAAKSTLRSGALGDRVTTI